MTCSVRTIRELVCTLENDMSWSLAVNKDRLGRLQDVSQVNASEKSSRYACGSPVETETFSDDVLFFTTI